MTKSRRLNVSVPRDELVALQARAHLCIQSPRNYLCPLIVTYVNGGISSLFDIFPYRIIFADVSIHYLIVLIRNRRVVAILTIEAKCHSIDLGRIISVNKNIEPNEIKGHGKCKQNFFVHEGKNTIYFMCVFVLIMNVVTEIYFMGVNNG